MTQFHDQLPDTSIVALPSLAAAPPYLSDVLRRIQDDKEISPVQRRDLTSAIKRVCHLSGMPAENVPATTAGINPLLAALNPAKCDVTPQTFHNILSGLRRSFRRYTKPQSLTVAKGTQLSVAWQQLMGSCHDKKILFGLHRFIAFCSARGWEPSSIDVGHYEQFVSVLKAELLRKDPASSVRRVAVQWNRATKLVSGWPATELPVPKTRQGYTQKWDTFPLSFREEVECWLKLRAEPDLTSEIPRAPLKASTIEGRRWMTLEIASALVHRGVSPAAITSLAALVEGTHPSQALKYFLERAGNKTTTYISGLAIHIKTIFRECCPANAETEKKLTTLCRNLAKRPHGMKEKIRRRLLPFKNPNTARKLLRLPDVLLAEAAVTPQRDEAAALVRLALWIDILIFCPMRAANLLGLNLNKHLIHSGVGRARRTMLVIPPEEVKNNVELVFELRPRTIKILELYLKQYRAGFSSVHNTLLFPARNGKPVRHATLYASMMRTTERFIGHKINPHLFRHLMGMLYLIERPGQVDVVRRVLGHKNHSTTTNFYLGLESDAAIELFDKVIDEMSGSSFASKKGAR